MKLFGFSLLSFLVVALMAMPAVAGKAPAPAARFIDGLGQQALSSLTARDLPRATREKRVRELLRTNFDVPTIAKFAMGTYWRQMSESQRGEYMNLFEEMVVQTYTTRFEDYSGQTMEVDPATVSGGHGDALVKSKILQKDGPPVNLEWRVSSKTGGMKVIDVVVEGVSMSVTQRSEFSAVIQRGGGKIDALLASLRERKSGNSKL